MFGSNSSFRTFSVTKTPAQNLAVTNKVYVDHNDPILNKTGQNGYVLICSKDDEAQFVYNVEANSGVNQQGLVALSLAQRRILKVDLNDPVKVSPYAAGNSAQEAQFISADVDFLKSRLSQEEVHAGNLSDRIRNLLASQIVRPDQQVIIDLSGTMYVITIRSIVMDAKDPAVFEGKIGKYTVFQFEGAKSNIKITGQASVGRKIIREEDLASLEKLGIGGLSRQFQLILRRAFGSRQVPPQIAKELGIQHVRGMLLFGPPGTGKTLMARQIGKILNAAEPKVVNGPEILNKYVGQSEENIRKLFEDAESEYASKGEDSQLHIIIFDEIDALFKQRGSRQGGTGVEDNIVNQVLTKIDGVNALDNILIIGMTNRKDLLDEALLRPGRLEVQVEIGLPDLRGREEIFRIHTEAMRASNRLSDDVSLHHLATRAENYTGAEIKGVVNSATSYAVYRSLYANKELDMLGKNNPQQQNAKVADIKVSHSDFEKALEEVRPAYGNVSEQLEVYFEGGIIDYGSRYQFIRESCEQAINRIKNATLTGSSGLVETILFTGTDKTGKTALAVHLGASSRIPYVRVFEPDRMSGQSEYNQIQMVIQAFEDAYKSPMAILILDRIERIIGYHKIGPYFTRDILNTLLNKIGKAPPRGHKLIVVGTMRSEEVARELELNKEFNIHLRLDSLNAEEVEKVLLQMGAFSQEQMTQARGLMYYGGEQAPIGKLVKTVNDVRLDMEMKNVPGDGQYLDMDLWQSHCSDQQL